MTKKTSVNMGLYLVKPEVKPGVVWPSIPKDAKPSESQYAYFARKYMAAQAARCVSEKSTRNRSYSLLRSRYARTCKHD